MSEFIVLWEYLFLYWTETTSVTTPAPDSGQVAEREWERVISIWQPGTKEPEPLDRQIIVVRSGMESDEHVVKKEFQRSWMEHFTSLGSQGWELVSTTPMSSVVISPMNGYPTGGHPVDLRYIFKRSLPG
jgi:hypothetical protein